MAPYDDPWRDDGHISADITAMEDFARKLLADVDDQYAPFADTLANRMLAGLPAADHQFGELHAFTTVLASAQDTCQQNIYNFANGTHGFAKAAEQVSGLYRGADAFARARLSDVESALVTAGLLPPAEVTSTGGPSVASSAGSTTAPSPESPAAPSAGSPAAPSAGSPAAPSAGSPAAPSPGSSAAPSPGSSAAPSGGASVAPPAVAGTSADSSIGIFGDKSVPFDPVAETPSPPSTAKEGA
ncbi:hypothetical protein [Actinoplanes sp. NPDC020271]|uniref:hypothetical protein n=1 Tax=Actinoplanes sp. NPDC020271 TaxID=3363896 RepID=UPI00378BE877